MSQTSYQRTLVSVCLVIVAATTWPSNRFVPSRQPRPDGYWFKGNTHTHTLQSDGDSTPDEVVAWYRSHDYDFLFVTDHNKLSQTEALNAAYGADHQLLVIQGEEVTDSVEGRPVHLNALGPTARVDPQHGTSVVDVMQRDVDAIRRAGGIPLLNHPNYIAPIGAAALLRVERTTLFELFNAHPETNSLGSAGVLGMEAVWDQILSSGRVMYGVADDDAHTFQPSMSRHRHAVPGQGWVYVHAEHLEAQSILAALARGDFYSSTGVELRNYTVAGGWMTVEIQARPSRAYRVQFIGQNGRVLHETTATCASYEFSPDDTYVRVRIEDFDGCVRMDPARVPAD